MSEILLQVKADSERTSGVVPYQSPIQGNVPFERQRCFHRQSEPTVAFDPAEFNTLATWLVENATNEVHLRTAICRVYYAGHLLAVHRLRKKGWEPNGSGDNHTGVIRRVRDGNTRLLGDELSRLRELREHADYHLEASASVLNEHC
jgi:hypothetical protein